MQFTQNRRQTIIRIAGTILCCGYGTISFAQITPLALRLARRTGWEQLMGKNQCVIGDLYVSTPDFPITDPGRKLCNALELAWRNNMTNISSLPLGIYEGFVRTDGSKGWRIELVGSGDRKNVQIHIGNKTADSIGCILLGTGNSNDANCFIGGSAAAMTSLRNEYGESTLRKVVLLIQA
jgi:hypothetical protein